MGEGAEAVFVVSADGAEVMGNRILTTAEAAASFSEMLREIAREIAAENGTSYEDELRFGVEALAEIFFEGPKAP